MSACALCVLQVHVGLRRPVGPLEWPLRVGRARAARPPHSFTFSCPLSPSLTFSHIPHRCAAQLEVNDAMTEVELILALLASAEGHEQAGEAAEEGAADQAAVSNHKRELRKNSNKKLKMPRRM